MNLSFKFCNFIRIPRPAYHLYSTSSEFYAASHITEALICEAAHPCESASIMMLWKSKRQPQSMWEHKSSNLHSPASNTPTNEGHFRAQRGGRGVLGTHVYLLAFWVLFITPSINVYTKGGNCWPCRLKRNMKKILKICWFMAFFAGRQSFLKIWKILFFQLKSLISRTILKWGYVYYWVCTFLGVVGVGVPIID